MKIYIELVIMLLLSLIFTGWAIWFRVSHSRLVKKYHAQQNENKNKKGGETNGREIEVREQPVELREPAVEKPSRSVSRSKEPRGQLVLPTPTASKPRKNVSGTRKNSSGIGKLLRRRRKI
jgi:hypothetical protein